jgi:hypothetical protein
MCGVDVLVTDLLCPGGSLERDTFGVVGALDIETDTLSSPQKFRDRNLVNCMR